MASFWFNYLFKDPIFKCSHNLRFWGGWNNICIWGKGSTKFSHWLFQQMIEGKRLFSLGKICAWSKKRHVLWMGLSRELLETSNNDSSEHETVKELQFRSHPSRSCSLLFCPTIAGYWVCCFCVFFNCCPCWVFTGARAFSLVGAGRGHSLGAMHGLLVVVASLVADHGLWNAQTSAVVAHTLSCSSEVGSSRTRGQTHVSCIDRSILYHWAPRGSPSYCFLRLT